MNAFFASSVKNDGTISPDLLWNEEACSSAKITYYSVHWIKKTYHINLVEDQHT